MNNYFEQDTLWDCDTLKQLAIRSSTDGFQPKFFSADRSTFIKLQANMSGIVMKDWMVEILACEICKHWKIPCVWQKHCRVQYNGQIYDGVMSDNFEKEGLVFQSFHSIIARHFLSASEDYFVKLSSIEKLKWCANCISEFCMLDRDACEKYMLDLALVDCFVGNIDRHTKNFGAFYNTMTGKYEIARIFDSGMGLFENDPYRDGYQTYESAMHHVYVAPYGEDPFDFLDMLAKEFELTRYCLNGFTLPEELIPNEFAGIYLQQITKKLMEVA